MWYSSLAVFWNTLILLISSTKFFKLITLTSYLNSDSFPVTVYSFLVVNMLIFFLLNLQQIFISKVESNCHKKVKKLFVKTILWLVISRRSPPGVLWKRCSENMQQICRRTPMPKCDFNEVALQFYWNHISTWVFSCKFAAYLQKTLL